MRVAILGAGAMGTVLGAFMTKNGCKVDMIDSYTEHVKALNEKGAKIIGFADMTVPVSALTPCQMEGTYDLVFLFTKQTTNEEVLRNLIPHLNAASTVCTLQNGVPEVYVAEKVGGDRTVGGTVLWGATFIGPGVSELTQDISRLAHLFEIGEIDGKISGRIKKVAEILGYMGPAEISSELMDSRWTKLVANACMSGMSAACGCTFGEVLDNPKARACLCYIGNEVKKTCEADGHKLHTLLNYDLTPLSFKKPEDFEVSQKMFINIYNGLRSAKASMLQDLERGKKTEVNMLNGFVSDTARKYGIATPFCDTVVKVITGIESRHLPLSMDNLKYFKVPGFQE
ncbi:ketopantoate reductase family protein [Papillibacter cinnamivorans]|uniref:2-dehydropantoate 2-reductase n=1 Tax=Papillibacter cinnamivorans DSM 12816 TaxID=1122930 RepID=A0A1W1YWZ4_9FIRM|nr:ketopantoate reductase family protein [Papillibacter cinnamivorans]SMC40612.1 2-dehydropantoate 2-reductase [Papillibacter cinnamivorans DSM 12816]